MPEHVKTFGKLSLSFQLLLIVKTLRLHLRRLRFLSGFVILSPPYAGLSFSSADVAVKASEAGSTDLAPFCLQQIASVPKQVL